MKQRLLKILGWVFQVMGWMAAVGAVVVFLIRPLYSNVLPRIDSRLTGEVMAFLEQSPFNYTWLQWLTFEISMISIGLIFVFTGKVLVNVGKDVIFHTVNVRYFRLVGICATLVSFLVYEHVNSNEIVDGGMFLLAVIAFVASSVLSRATEIAHENELTI